ncbi:hypothetical protein [Caldalkalibacillus mannanilyticus]|uniref:hypothetical protein n=1 Tax=Caldalkalibacillus mannanilyticus TaxID=1418 RepID=UPI000AB69A9F|nr:hypothetical protein [Caldalkalibacillus mannanilyticus]
MITQKKDDRLWRENSSKEQTNRKKITKVPQFNSTKQLFEQNKKIMKLISDK